MYSAASSFSQTIGPVRVGASLSGEVAEEDLLCRLSFDDFGLRVYVDMIVVCSNLLQRNRIAEQVIVYARGTWKIDM
jgi:hypothetical protein